jgi:predicted RNA-binding Zn-ribbon protein involved in translation (DUF1610 family)
MADSSQIPLYKLFSWLKFVITRYARLEERVTELEKRLEKRSESNCPSCGGMQFFIAESLPRYLKEREIEVIAPSMLFEYAHTFKCKECGYSVIKRERATPK